MQPYASYMAVFPPQKVFSLWSNLAFLFIRLGIFDQISAHVRIKRRGAHVPCVIWRCCEFGAVHLGYSYMLLYTGGVTEIKCHNYENTLQQ